MRTTPGKHCVVAALPGNILQVEQENVRLAVMESIHLPTNLRAWIALRERMRIIPVNLRVAAVLPGNIPQVAKESAVIAPADNIPMKTNRPA